MPVFWHLPDPFNPQHIPVNHPCPLLLLAPEPHIHLPANMRVIMPRLIWIQTRTHTGAAIISRSFRRGRYLLRDAMVCQETGLRQIKGFSTSKYSANAICKQHFKQHKSNFLARKSDIRLHQEYQDYVIKFHFNYFDYSFEIWKLRTYKFITCTPNAM